MSRDDDIAAALRPTFAREGAVLATQIEEAAATGRRGDVGVLAHRLVGTAGTVHERDLVTASRRLEQVALDDGADETALRAQARDVVAALRASVARIDTGPPATTAGGQPAGEPGPRPVVVAIEDNAANVELLERILAGSGAIELVTAQSGVEGVRLARERSAALVLLDLNLPDVSGEWVLAAAATRRRPVRGSPSSAPTPGRTSRSTSGASAPPTTSRSRSTSRDCAPSCAMRARFRPGRVGQP